MLFLVRTFAAFALIVAVVLVALALIIVEKTPLVESNPRLAAADLSRVKGILEEHDPRRMKAGTIRTLTLSERELTLVTNHLVNYYGSGGTDVQLRAGTLVWKASMRVPGDRWGFFFNLRGTMVQEHALLEVNSLQLGGLSVSGWLAERILRTFLRFLSEKSAADLIQSVAISEGMLRVTYQWQPEVLDAVRRRMVPEADATRLKLFHAKLVELTDEHAHSKRVSLALFLRGLFEFAATRRRANPVADNRAVLMVLGTYVNARSLEELVPEARSWRKPKRLTLTLAGRKDLAQHFLTSAALAVTGGGFFSDTMGLYKEIDDAKEGSGFSFSDLAADRAGIRFSELATHGPEAAKKLWHVFAGPIQESDFMPSIKNLPEFMTESAFHSRFGTVGSHAYNRVAQEIEERISALSLYRQG